MPDVRRYGHPRRTIRFSPEEWARALRVADSLGTTVSALVRDCLASYPDPAERTPNGENQGRSDS